VIADSRPEPGTLTRPRALSDRLRGRSARCFSRRWQRNGVLLTAALNPTVTDELKKSVSQLGRMIVTIRVVERRLDVRRMPRLTFSCLARFLTLGQDTISWAALAAQFLGHLLPANSALSGPLSASER